MKLNCRELIKEMSLGEDDYECKHNWIRQHQKPSICSKCGKSDIPTFFEELELL